MRKLFLWFHLYASLASSIFIVIVCLTGSILAFEGELDHLFHPSLFKVAVPADAQSVHKPLAELGRIAAQDDKDHAIFFSLPTTPTSPLIASMKNRRQVFLNPYTGEILGTRTGLTLLGKIHQFHTKLLIGNTGKTIVGITTIFLTLLTISGIYLWWPSKRFSVKWGASARRIHFDLHHVIGITSCFVVLVLCLTGLFINFDDKLVPKVYQWTNSAPTPRNIFSTAPQPGARSITAEEAIEIAQRAIPGTQAINLSPVSGPKAAYRVALRFPEDLTPGGRSWANIDQYSGQVLMTQNSRTPPAGTRYVIMNRAIHTGDIFGIPSKIVASLACLAVLGQLVTGIYLWWKKRGGSQLLAES